MFDEHSMIWPRSLAVILAFAFVVADGLAASLSAAPSATNRPSSWALQPLRKPPVPNASVAGQPADSPAHPIDAFIRQRLAARGLRLSPPADRRTLLRRLSFDMLGLPPT